MSLAGVDNDVRDVHAVHLSPHPHLSAKGQVDSDVAAPSVELAKRRELYYRAREQTRFRARAHASSHAQLKSIT
jgi:hypothetical protein